jgi:hypothetical protein
MKKYNILIIAVLFLTTTLVVILLFLRNDHVIQIFTFEKSYGYIMDKNKEMEYTLYFTTDDTFYTSSEMVESIKLKTDSELLSLKLIDIIHGINTIEVKNKTYIPFIFKTEIDGLEFSDELLFENAYLSIVYKNYTILDIKIGSVNFVSCNQQQDKLEIDQLKAIMNNISNQDEMVGVVIGFNTNYKAIIKNIRFVNPFISFDVSYAKGLTEDINVYTPISDVLGFNYNNIGVGNKASLNVNSSVRYFIPIKYSNRLKNNCLSFIIEYEVDKNPYTLYFDNFKFFDRYYISEREINDLTIYKYAIY